MQDSKRPNIIMAMKKLDAAQYFGSQAAMARALGITRSAVAQWPAELTTDQADRVVGAYLRTRGIKVEMVKSVDVGRDAAD